MTAFTQVTPDSTPVPTRPTSESIVKGRSDLSHYRRVLLDNGVDVLLVQDSDTLQAGCAVDVGVGAWADPAVMPGIAHLTEHLMFLGTK